MKKIVLLLATAMILSGISGTAFAASDRCKVLGISEDTLTIQCKKPEKFKVGDNLKIKTDKAKKQIEGC